MQSQRLTSAESLLKTGNISVRDFIRALALSPLYREKFFDGVYQVRFIELNYKHLLGRAPYDESEIAHHVDLYQNLHVVDLHLVVKVTVVVQAAAVVVPAVEVVVLLVLEDYLSN